MKFSDNPFKFGALAWGVLIVAFVVSATFLPLAQALYNGETPVLGFLLHRSFIVLFVLAALLAVLSVILQILRPAESFSKRLIRIFCGFLVGAPVAFIGGIAALFLLIGKYMGVALE